MLFRSVITACVFYALYRRIEVGRSGVRFDATVIRVCGLIILGVALQSLAYGALNFITLFAQQSETLDSYSSMMENLNGTKTMWIFLYTMLFAPIVEETVFRGFIFKSCRMGFGVIGANVIQALGFAIFHGNIVQAIYAFVLGMFLGYVMFQRESLIEVIGLHIVINAAGIFIAPVAAAIITVFAGREIAYTVLIVTSLTLVAGWVIIQNRLKKAEIIL